MVNVPLLTPVIGVPGWTWPSWRKSMFQVKALAGSVAVLRIGAVAAE